MAGQHFAVALTFSPRFRAMACEADRVARQFGARLSVLHAGERSDEKVEKFHELFGQLGRDEVDIYWCEGDTPGEALVDASGSEYFDLLIAGALDRPNEFRNFTGGVVKELLQEAPCDLLLIPSPKEEPPAEAPTACLLVEAHAPRWRAACHAIERIAPRTISVLAADSPFAHARDGGRGGEGPEERMAEMCGVLEGIAPGVDVRTVQSNTGFVLCDIVQETCPDYLIVEAAWKGRKRLLPPHLDWLNQVIPARLLLLGKPVSDAAVEL